MKFKVLSDLHIDINREYTANMKFDREAFYLIAGDVSGDRIKTQNFLQGKRIKGVFVEGNHFGYNVVTGNKFDTKQKSIEYLQEEFSHDKPLVFLENDYIIVDDVVIVGATLYTDFKLFDNPVMAGLYALSRMNDFRYVKTLDGNQIRRVIPNDYIDWFNTSINYIDFVCKTHPDKKIVVVTHHVPSLKGIELEYQTDALTPAYASNLDDFILEHSNIKLWVHGHTHHKSQYEIGGTKLVCNPYGYDNENLMDLNTDLGLEIEI